MALLTADQLRSAVATLNDEGKFSDALLEGYVAEFEEIAEDYRGVAFEPRYAVETILTPRALGALRLRHRPVRSVSSFTVDGTAVSSDDYELDALVGAIIYTLSENVTAVIGYVHGLGYRKVTDGATTNADATVTSATAAFTSADVGERILGTGIPAGARIVSINSATSVEISVNATASGSSLALTIAPNETALRACREYVRSCALSDRSSVPRDVIGQSFEGNYTRYSTPDKDAGRPTGWLEVDRLLNQLPRYQFGIA